MVTAVSVLAALAVCVRQMPVLPKRLHRLDWFLALLRPSTYPILNFNLLMHKVAKMVTRNNGVRRHTGVTHGFYRAMHFSAKRGIAIVCLSLIHISEPTRPY